MQCRSRNTAELSLRLALAVGLVGCGGQGGIRSDGGTNGDAETVSSACPPPAPTSCPSPTPHYPDIAPIVAERCVVCHSGLMPAIWPLTDFRHVADWQDLIHDDLLACTMPPADAGFQMTTAERVAILSWIRCGFLE